MEESRFRTPVPDGRKPGCSVLGWVLFFVAFVVIIFVGYRTKGYYDRLRSGDIVELPQFTQKFTAGRKTSPVAVADRAVVESGDQPTLGTEEGAVLTIVEFADFECPYSKEEAPVIRQLMAKYGDRVRFVYRDYPIESLHADARQASVAAECAREQGKFWAYHDKLYANAPSLGFSSLLRYAEEAGLDEMQFERCLTENRYLDAVVKDTAAAAELGVAGTPTFFLNGQKVEGAVPVEAFERLIESFLKK
jgi:protein-disulfide isomerase